MMPASGIADLGRAYRRGALRPSDVVDQLLERDGLETIFRFVTAERARAQAAHADELFRRGIDRGPLQGVPLGLKDLIDTRGAVTTVGSDALADAPPAREDADVAVSLDAAGAVFVGKTTMTEFAFSGLGLNQHSPVPMNVLEPERVPGGSSSGSAVGVASGLLPAAVGSDTGGSVRIPAAFNGLVGLKPSKGALSMHGVASVSLTLDTLGPLARDPADAWALWLGMKGAVHQAFQARPVRGLRLAVPITRFQDGLDDEVGDAFECSCERLSEQGAVLVRMTAPVVDEIDSAYQEQLGIGTIEAYATFQHLLRDRAEIIDPRVVRRLSVGHEASGADLARLLVWRSERIRSFWRAFADYDALLAPTVPILPPLLSVVTSSEEAFATLNAVVVRNTRIANYLGCPSATVPATREGRLRPVGVMTMTRRGEEHLALSVADAAATNVRHE